MHVEVGIVLAVSVLATCSFGLHASTI